MQIIVFDHFNVSHVYTAIILSNLDTKNKLDNNWQHFFFFETIITGNINQE